MHKVMLAHRLLYLHQKSRGAVHISLCQFQTGKKDLTQNESVNDLFILTRQLEALLAVLSGGIQIVPFVEDTCQAEMRFMDNLLRLITCPLQDAPIGLDRRIKLVVYFLYVTQADCRQYSCEDIPGCLTERYGFHISLAGCGTLSPEKVGIP